MCLILPNGFIEIFFFLFLSAMGKYNKEETVFRLIVPITLEWITFCKCFYTELHYSFRDALFSCMIHPQYPD